MNARIKSTAPDAQHSGAGMTRRGFLASMGGLAFCAAVGSDGIRLMSQAADQISTGNTDVADLKEKGKDEVAQLAKAFNRMRRSLAKAIDLIDKA